MSLPPSKHPMYQSRYLVRPSRYRIWGLVGSGQFGKVYVARDRLNGELVALKQLDQKKFPTHKFLRELRFLLSLNHPNIVSYIALEHSRHSRFLVMEYCEAGTLRDAIMYGSKLTYRQIIQIVNDLLSGLEHSHRLNIIHCDLKPENILLKLSTQGWQAKITDFGIARQHHEAKKPDSANTGSPGYMAPERFYGQATVASDIYAIGIILYELLLQQRPFAGMPKELMFAHLNHRVQMPETVPTSLRAIILKALEKLPRKRFRSAEQMRLALVRLFDLGEVELDLVPPPLIETDGELILSIIEIDDRWQIESSKLAIRAISGSGEKILYVAGNCLYELSLFGLGLGLWDFGTEVYGLKQLANQILVSSKTRIFDWHCDQIEELWELPPLWRSFQWLILPSQRWLVTAYENVLLIQSLTKSEASKITVILKGLEVISLATLNPDHFAILALETASQKHQILVMARRGQILWQLPLAEAISQMSEAYIPNKVVLVSATSPYTLLFVDLSPYRIKRCVINFQPRHIVPTVWGYLIDAKLGENHSLIRLIDHHGQTLGKLQIPGNVTAMHLVQAHLAAIASQTEEGNQLYLIDLKQLEIDLIF